MKIRSRTIRAAFSAALMVLLANSLLAQAGEVEVKFINTSNRPVLVRVGEGESEVFGLASRPVLYAALASNEMTEIEIEEVSDEAVPQVLVQRAVEGSVSLIQAANAGTDLVRLSAEATVSAGASGLALNLLEVSEAARRMDPRYIADFLVHDALAVKPSLVVKPFAQMAIASEAAVKAASSAQVTMVAGLAGLGLRGLEWGLSSYTDKSAKHLLKIHPEELAGFSVGMQIVINIGPNGDLKVQPRIRPPQQSKLTCLLESKSKFPLLCLYRDGDGDLCGVRLNNKRFTDAAIEFASAYPEIAIAETSAYAGSLSHSCMSLARVATNTVAAVIDPFPITKIMSAVCAVNDVYTATNGFADHLLSRRNLKVEVMGSSKIKIEDEGRYQLKLTVTAVEDIAHLPTP